MEQLPSKLSTLFSGIVSSHPGFEYQWVAEFGVILNYHEFARKTATSIQRQYPNFIPRCAFPCCLSRQALTLVLNGGIGTSELVLDKKAKNMNPERIYQQHREDALRGQIEANKYSTFVAMPFRDSFSYQSKTVFKEIIQRAAEVANRKKTARIEFDMPKRVDDASGQAVVITEEIVVDILQSHIFLADLTFQNPNVILETGVALGLKPNRQIILISQGTAAELHFDIRNNKVNFYHDSSDLETLADALIAAAAAFEKDVDKYVDNVLESLSEAAIQCLRWRAQKMGSDPNKSLHSGTAADIFKTRPSCEPALLFQLATQELLQRKLLYMHFGKNDQGDFLGMYATRLGEVLIHRKWPEFFAQPGMAP
jgi:hypothetical protein